MSNTVTKNSSITGSFVKNIDSYSIDSANDDGMVQVEKFFVGTVSKVVITTIGIFETIALNLCRVIETPLYGLSFTSEQQHKNLVNHTQNAAQATKDAFVGIFSPYKKIVSANPSSQVALNGAKEQEESFGKTLQFGAALTAGISLGIALMILMNGNFMKSNVEVPKNVNSWTWEDLKHWGSVAFIVGSSVFYKWTKFDELSTMTWGIGIATVANLGVYGLSVMSEMTGESSWINIASEFISKNIFVIDSKAAMLFSVATVLASVFLDQKVFNNRIFGKSSSTINYKDLFIGIGVAYVAERFFTPLSILQAAGITFAFSRTIQALNNYYAPKSPPKPAKKPVVAVDANNHVLFTLKEKSI